MSINDADGLVDPCAPASAALRSPEVPPRDVVVSSRSATTSSNSTVNEMGRVDIGVQPVPGTARRTIRWLASPLDSRLDQTSRSDDLGRGDRLQ